MWIGEIDVRDDVALRGFWEAGREGDAYERPFATFWSYESAVVSFREVNLTMDKHAIAAVEDGETIGVAEVSFPRLDNAHVGYVEVIVRPARRRRGVGSALLDAALELCRAHGRLTVIAETAMPYASSRQSPGVLMLEKRGFTLGSLDVHRVLELPVDEARLDSLAASSDATEAGYSLRTFKDRVPDALVEGFCRLQSAFNQEAPLGELDLESEVWTEERVRANEARFAKQRRHIWTTVAVSPSGGVVALSELVTSDSDATTGWQSGTLVLPQHRGHRLGTVIKVANLRAYTADFPSVRLIHSWNAEQNAAMVAINDSLGFRPVEYAAEMQLRL